jgi:hypothetical protein
MYLGLVIVTLGIAIWVGAWPMFIAPVALFATLNWVHIPFEEEKMRRQFGATYDGYVRQVRRWVWRWLSKPAKASKAFSRRVEPGLRKRVVRKNICLVKKAKVRVEINFTLEVAAPVPK